MSLRTVGLVLLSVWPAFALGTAQAQSNSPQEFKDSLTSEFDPRDPEAVKAWASDILEKAKSEEASTVTLTAAGFAYIFAKPKGKMAVACDYWRRAADRDYVPAMHFLGECYANGWLTYDATAQVQYWYGKAAEGGSWTSLCALGELRMHGRLLDKDVPAGIAECTKAAENGSIEAQLTLGDIHVNRRFREPDFETAALWYGRAAEKDNPKAAYALAQMHFAGDHLQASRLAAARYAEVAAVARYPKAAELTARLLWLELASDEAKFASRMTGEMGWREYYWLRRASESPLGSPQIRKFYENFQTQLPESLHEDWRSRYESQPAPAQDNWPPLTDLG